MPEKEKSKELIVHAAEHQITKFDKFDSVDEMMKFAQKLIDGKLIPHSLKTPEAVVSVIVQGRELGFEAMTALSNIHNIQGKPALGIHAIGALLRRHGIKYELTEDYVYVLPDGSATKVKPEKFVNMRTTITFYERFGDKIISTPLSFHLSEAKNMGLLEKDNWKKMMRIMMRNRCLAIGARFVAPEAMMGMYEVSEMAEIQNQEIEVDENGVFVVEKDD